jgi:hypothetical protein
MKISAKTKTNPTPVEVEFDLPEGQALVDKYGLDLVAGKAHGALVIDIQAAMRRALDAGKSQAEIQELVNGWQPGVRGPVTKQDPFTKAKNALAGLTDAQRKELAALLRAQ